MTALLETRGLTKHFKLRGPGNKVVRAVNDVSLRLDRGRTLGLVGESGCGKSTIGRMLLRLVEPTSGAILLDGEDVAQLAPAAFQEHRKHIQIVFQDPFSSLNPRHRISRILAAPLIVHRTVPARQRRDRCVELLERVGLGPADLDKYPHQFSGGQRQRIGIARALALEPSIIVCDEAVSALDVSVQAQIINLLRRIQKDTGVAYLFISHDLAVVEHISHRVAVMYLGRIVEEGEREQIFEAPQHPYTEALLAAVPNPDPEKRRSGPVVTGEIPSAVSPPSGCPFHPRCPLADGECAVTPPPLSRRDVGRLLACHKR